MTKFDEIYKGIVKNIMENGSDETLLNEVVDIMLVTSTPNFLALLQYYPLDKIEGLKIIL